MKINIESVRGRKVKIVGSHSIGDSKQKIEYVRVSYSERFPRESLIHVQYTVQTSNTPCPHTSCKVH
jgi:hypothetical protein